MNNPKLDKLIQELQQHPVPGLPGSFSSDVLREIRLQAATPSSLISHENSIFSLWFRPAFLAATFSITVAVALILPAVDKSHANHDSQTVASMHLKVFSPSAMNIPSTLLTSIP